MNLRNAFTIKGDVFALSVTINNTCYQYVGKVGSSDEDDAISEIGNQVEKAIKRGRTATYDDGSKEWITSGEEITEDGQLIWHTDADRVRWYRTHIQVTADGSRTETPLLPVWRQPS